MIVLGTVRTTQSQSLDGPCRSFFKNGIESIAANDVAGRKSIVHAAIFREISPGFSVNCARKWPHCSHGQTILLHRFGQLVCFGRKDSGYSCFFLGSLHYCLHRRAICEHDAVIAELNSVEKLNETFSRPTNLY